VNLTGLPEGKGIKESFPLCPRERSNLRRAERELKALGQVRLRGVERSDPDELERFYRLEASGRKGRERSAILCDRRSVQFFSEVAREAARLNYFSLNMLERDGKLLAARFGLTCGRAPTPESSLRRDISQVHARAPDPEGNVVPLCPSRNVGVFNGCRR